jgi:hypothetical protein
MDYMTLSRAKDAEYTEERGQNFEFILRSSAQSVSILIIVSIWIASSHFSAAS